MSQTPADEIVVATSGITFRDKFIAGRAVVEFEVSGDLEEKADSEDPMPNSALLVATVTEMFSDGTLFLEMQRRFGHDAMVTLEDKG